MVPFNGYHIQNFNQRVKSLMGDGRVAFDHKELRALQAEILDLLLRMRELESQLQDKREEDQKVINIEMVGKSFK